MPHTSCRAIARVKREYGLIAPTRWINNAQRMAYDRSSPFGNESLFAQDLHGEVFSLGFSARLIAPCTIEILEKRSQEIPHWIETSPDRLSGRAQTVIDQRVVSVVDVEFSRGLPPLLNALGADELRSIHHHPASLSRQVTRMEVFPTGVKTIDRLRTTSPFVPTGPSRDEPPNPSRLHKLNWSR